MRIQDWRDEIGKHFPEFVIPAEIAISVLCQLLIDDISNPFGLVFVGMPSSGKTITLNFFSELTDLVYTTDNFSPASFVSHASNVKKEQLDKIDLLPKIRNKVLIVRDLAPILGKRDDDLLTCMGILTRVFDGEGLQIDSGLHGQRGYNGDYLFMFLAASTPIAPKVWKVMGNFGSRLFFFYVDTPDKSPQVLADQLTSQFSVKDKEKECRAKTKEFVLTLWDRTDGIFWDRAADNKAILEELALLAHLVACLRGTINVWKDGQGDESYNHSIPQIEKPDRINQSFYNLARGHAVACGRTAINDEDLSIVIKVALGSASLDRIKAFNLLIKSDGVLTTEQVIHGLKCSRPTAISLMEKMEHLNLVNEVPATNHAVGRSEKVVRVTERFLWFVGTRFKELNALIGSNLLNQCNLLNENDVVSWKE